MKTLQDKVVQALIEGCFFKKVINKIDRELGLLTRKFVSKTSKVENKKIMFMTYQNDYACNPKYIVEEIIRQNLDWDIVFVVKNINKVAEHFPSRVRLVKRNSYEFYKEAMTSKIWVDNAINFFYEDVPKNSSQILINTWHGSMGLKRVGKDDNKNKKWVTKAMRADKDTNYCISDSDFEMQVYRETYWPNVEILNYGHPRNDILFTKDRNVIKQVKEKVCDKLGITEDASFALYAPTFRDTHDIDCYNIDYTALIASLEKRFGGKWIVLARHHFHLWNSKVAKESIKDLKGVVRATDYDDMQELMLVSDVGITDYSSWICDYVLTGKPGFIFATDLNDYNNERGLYYPIETTPFPVAECNDQLVNNIVNFDENKYKRDKEVFLQRMGCVEEGKASYSVVMKIKELMER